MKTAILFGASGLIGSLLLPQLLDDPAYDKVTIVVRKLLPVQHPKLTQLIGDLASLQGLKDQLRADEVFISLGTTKAKTPDQEEYYRIDHDYPLEAARIGRENGAKSVLLVSAVGANSGSGVFYVRTKGKTEEDIIALDYPHTYIFRPSMLMGDRQEKRPLEKFLIGLFRVINPLFVGGAKKYRGIDVKDVAKAMIRAANDASVKVKIYEWAEIRREARG